jgi:antitoxin component YwqK of YwqJK toxin-antitoxin module
VKEYYESGVLKEKTNYLNHIKSGNSEYYNKQSKLVKRENYFHGSIYDVQIF